MKWSSRAFLALALVATLAACGQPPSPSGGPASPPPSPAADEHAGHTHASPAADEHAGHTHASPAADEHAGHAHASPAAGPALQAKMGSDPEPPVAGEPARVGFLVTSGGQPVRDYDVVHEKKAHMIVISGDLAEFQHLHPELDQQGAWIADVTLPNPGPYRFYLDVTPTGGAQQVLRSALTVPGTPPQRPPLKPDYGPARVDGLEVALKTDPPHLHAADAMLTFTLTRDGKPVTDLKPYLGAMGHLVIVDESGERFLHAHPIEGGDAAKGVAFHAAFPAGGLYKLWAQFQVGDRVVTAPFVVHVQ